MSEEKIVLTFMRLTDSYLKGEVPGIETYCKDCNHKVWLSDTTISSLKQMRPDVDLVKDPPKVICIECLMKLAKTNEVKIMPPSSEQLDQILKALKKGI